MHDAARVHEDAIIIDGVSPLLQDKQFIDMYFTGKATCVAPTLAINEDPGETLGIIAAWLRHIDQRDDLLLVRTVGDIRRAKAEGKLGILFHFQGTSALADDVNLVDAYQALGVRMIMLTYNTKCLIGDGCEERTDSGLSRFGIKAIQRMNEKGILVDVSHTGYRTTMEAMEVSTKPVVFSHSNSKSLLDVPRNISDKQAQAAARTGGLVGVSLIPYFTVKGRSSTLDDFMAHIDHWTRLVGVEHVGLGLDYYFSTPPFQTEQESYKVWKKFVDEGIWDPKTYPPPPQCYPPGASTPEELQGVTAALLKRYSPEDTKLILGGNWMRVFEQAWTV